MATYQFTTEPIESTIIAYFDGRLSDHESAELLHRVSVSPEIRQMFQEHEALRQLTNRAARNTVVPASLEESLFNRLEGNRSRTFAPIAFWNVRRVSTAVGVVGVLLVMLASSLEFNRMNFSSSEMKVVATPTAATTSDVMPSATSSVAPTFSSPLSVANHVAKNARMISKPPTAGAKDNQNEVPNSMGTLPNKRMEEAQTIALAPAPRSAEVPRINMPGVGNAPMKSIDDLMATEENSRFELGIATDYAGWSTPANIPAPAQFFSNFSIRAGYNLDAQDQIGINVARATAGSVLTPSVSAGAGFTNVTTSFVPQQEFFEQLFYKRQQPFIVNNGLFYATASLSGGLYSNGTVLGASAGFEIPVGDHLLTGISVIVNRLHQNQTVQSYSTPVIFDGSSQYNFITGSFQYSLSYRF